MSLITLHVIDGMDKGRSFVNIPTPVTIGREEGNGIRLNDDRVSRFHAKIQEDQDKIVLTDLDSTNGTRVNGEAIQLRLLRPGDRVDIGRSILIFGSLEEIAESLKNDKTNELRSLVLPEQKKGPPGMGTALASSVSEVLQESFNVFQRKPPSLPSALSPAQAAELSEVLDYLHRALANATEPVQIPQNSKVAHLPIESWHRVQLVLTYLAQYSRHVAEPSDPPDLTEF